MLTYEELPDQARLWIYPANRELSPAEVGELDVELAAFATTWTSHRRDLQAYAGIWRGRFLVIGVDEAAASASGCSIDASVRFVRELGQRHDIDFFDRMTFFVEMDGDLRAYSAESFVAAYVGGEIDDRTTVFDPLVATKAAVQENFTKPLAESWHRRFVGA